MSNEERLTQIQERSEALNAEAEAVIDDGRRTLVEVLGHDDSHWTDEL